MCMKTHLFHCNIFEGLWTPSTTSYINHTTDEKRHLRILIPGPIIQQTYCLDFHLQPFHQPLLEDKPVFALKHNQKDL